MDPLIITTAEVIRFAVVLSRVSGIMVFAPFFNSSSIPVHMKVTLALVATVALVPSLPLGQVPADMGMLRILMLLVGQTLIGLILGLITLFLFAGMQLAGQIMSFQLGFALIHVIDPQSDVEMTVFSFIENYLGLLFFLLINGHHWFFLAVSDSFNYLPVQGIYLRGPVVAEVVRLSSQILISGLQIAAPIMAVTLTVDVVIGLIGRASPQIHILIVGMPLKILVGFACMGVSFYFLPHYFGELFGALHRDLFGLLHKLI